MDIKYKIIYIEIKIAELLESIRDKERSHPFCATYEEYCALREPEASEIDRLDGIKRMIMPYELSDIPSYGDVMNLRDFIEDVRCGNFIDYDGYGHYVKDGKMTNILIYPSDINKSNIRRDEFDTIIWFNR